MGSLSRPDAIYKLDEELRVGLHQWWCDHIDPAVSPSPQGQIDPWKLFLCSHLSRIHLFGSSLTAESQRFQFLRSWNAWNLGHQFQNRFPEGVTSRYHLSRFDPREALHNLWLLRNPHRRAPRWNEFRVEQILLQIFRIPPSKMGRKAFPPWNRLSNEFHT